MTGLTVAAAVLAFAIGLAASLVGGAAGGVYVGGRALGNELAAMMGGFYGPLAGFPGLILGLVVLMLIG